MFKTRLAVVSLLLLSLLLVASAAVAKPIGYVVATEGDGCLILPGGVEQAAVVPGPNHALELNDVLVTGPDSKMRVLLDRDGTMALGPESRLSLDSSVVTSGEEKVSGVKLLWGRVRTAIRGTKSQKRQFEVATETAVVGVKGTEFIVDAGPPPEGDTRASNANAPVQVLVVNGEVDFAGQSLTAGMGLVRFPNGSVQIMSAQAIADLQKGTTLQYIQPKNADAFQAEFQKMEGQFVQQLADLGFQPNQVQSSLVDQNTETLWPCPPEGERVGSESPVSNDFFDRIDQLLIERTRNNPMPLDAYERASLIFDLAYFCQDIHDETGMHVDFVTDEEFRDHFGLDEQYRREFDPQESEIPITSF